MRSRLSLAALACVLASQAFGGDLIVPEGILEAAGDPAYGEYLAGECITCHQLDGDYAGIPPLNGLESHYFIYAMLEYRQKLRNNVTMQTVAGRLSDEELAALAAYFKELD